MKSGVGYQPNHDKFNYIYYSCPITKEMINWRGGNEKYTTPIGTLLTGLLRKLAWENISLQNLADYFLHSGASGLGSGETREWQFDVFTDEIRRKIQSGGLCSNVWDEWCIAFL